MTDPSPEVMNVLVRLREGQVDPADLDALTNEQLFELGTAAATGRDLLHHVAVKLNQRGVPYVEIGKRINGAVESTASRWAKPLKPMGRPRRDREGDDGDE